MIRNNVLLVLAFFSLAAFAQRQDPATGFDPSYKSTYFGNNPDGPEFRKLAKGLPTRNEHGELLSVDLKKRTLLVAGPKGEKQELHFAVPAGSEKILVSKKAAQALGKRSMRFDELAKGQKVNVRYYPGMNVILQLAVEQAAAPAN